MLLIAACAPLCPSAFGPVVFFGSVEVRRRRSPVAQLDKETEARGPDSSWVAEDCARSACASVAPRQRAGEGEGSHSRARRGVPSGMEATCVGSGEHFLCALCQHRPLNLT